MKLIQIVLLSLLAAISFADVSHLKQRKHQSRQHYEEDDGDVENYHYLPPDPNEKALEQPYYKKEKHTSERVVYHKHEADFDKQFKEHHEPKLERIDHYHHYDKKPELKTKHVHYKISKPHLRTDYNADLFTPADPQTVYQRQRPHRILYASAPNSVFHTQINVQSQDSELNSQIRPDAQAFGGQLPAAGAGQSPSDAFPPGGAQLPTATAPGCQLFAGQIAGGGSAIGCGFPVTAPVGAQLATGALAPVANFPNNQGVPLPGSLAVLGNGSRPPNQSYRRKSKGSFRSSDNFFNPSLVSQLDANQLAVGQAPNAQHPDAQQVSGLVSQFPIAQLPTAQSPAAQLSIGQFPANQATAAQLPNQFGPAARAQQFPAGQADTTQFPMPLRRLRNGRQRNRSNYQGLNVISGNVVGQPQLQGPINALGNQQDTNIIDGNFYSNAGRALQGQRQNLVAVNGNRRTVLLLDEDDDDSVADGDSFGFAAKSPAAAYTQLPKKIYHKSGSKHHSDASVSPEYDTDYREDGYHYKKPKHSFDY